MTGLGRGGLVGWIITERSLRSSTSIFEGTSEIQRMIIGRPIIRLDVR